jgi:LysM repeat protein
MTQRQAILIIVVNAGISLVISMLVVWLVRSPQTPQDSLARTVPSDVPTRRASQQDLAPSGPGAAATPTLIIHTVRKGETLSYIAMKYDVSPERILEANALTDPDILAVDQQLLIPAPEVESTDEAEPAVAATPAVGTASPPATATAPASPTTTSPSPTPTATPAGEYRLEITQIMAPGRQEAEVLVLANHGRDARLQGWTLSNGRGRVYTFPRLTLFRGSSVRIYTTRGRNSASDLYWGLDSAAWGSDVEAAILKDPEGEVQTTRDLQ